MVNSGTITCFESWNCIKMYKIRLVLAESEKSLAKICVKYQLTLSLWWLHAINFLALTMLYCLIWFMFILNLLLKYSDLANVLSTLLVSGLSTLYTWMNDFGILIKVLYWVYLFEWLVCFLLMVWFTLSVVCARAPACAVQLITIKHIAWKVKFNFQLVI